ncbi:Oxysterol-binding protein-domain-containing protein [Scheffersomyces amazonensis]|uniref:Oxysterol-binding protein-domain-containing protein n=1 Tax=Scheffersomyces amazonensis TaxID=1078765 RepID=UPI00315DBFD4
METLEIHSKDFLVKWVHAPDNSVIDWQVKPLKRSINLAIYRKNEEILKENLNGSEVSFSSLNQSQASTSLTSVNRTASVTSVNQITNNNSYKSKSRSSTISSNINNSDLSLIKDYNKLIANELVHGKFEVTKGGMYAFIFDNSFSKTTGKKVFFSSKIIESNITRRKSSLGPIPNGASPNILRPKNGELLQSILLKKRRKKLQGFTKRYFILNFKYGTLSYFRVNDNKLRGQMPIKHSIVSANAKTREIIIDSGMEVWNLKALNVKEFNAWVDAFNEIKRIDYEDGIGEDNIDELEHSHIVSELELILSKFDQLKLQTDSPIVLEIQDDISTLISKVKPGNRNSFDAHSLVSSNDFYDANDYLDVTSTGVVLLDLPAPTSKLIDSKLADSPSEMSISEDQLDTVSTSSSSSEGDDDHDDVIPSLSKITSKIVQEGEGQEGDEDETLYPLPHDPIERESDIPVCNHSPPSILGFVRKNVGKDLSTIAMPVTMNEPISTLQKYSEMFEYCELIDNALQPSFVDESGEKILRIAAFAVSYLSSARVKERNNRKPFNPLLGETFELVREDKGIRLISEKVSHRPPVFAYFVDSAKWNLTFSPSPKQAFWGKNAEIVTKGVVKLTVKETNEVFTWSHPSTLLKNIIAGEKYTEPNSSITIKSSSGYRAVVDFAKGGMFSGRSEDLTIKAFGINKKELPYTVSGKWTESLTLKTNTTEKLIWECGELLPNAVKKFGFTTFAGQISKITPLEQGKLAPTDSRLRPDMKVYLKGDVDEAETLKVQLEEAQRTRRKELEDAGEDHLPKFFEKIGDGEPDSSEWVYVRGSKSYWNRRKNQDWDDLVSLW